MESEERAFIETLVRKGKESGIKPLISKMLDIYRSMMIYMIGVFLVSITVALAA